MLAEKTVEAGVKKTVFGLGFLGSGKAQVAAQLAVVFVAVAVEVMTGPVLVPVVADSVVEVATRTHLSRNV